MCVGEGKTPKKQGETVHFSVSIPLNHAPLKPLLHLYFLLYSV